MTAEQEMRNAKMFGVGDIDGFVADMKESITFGVMGLKGLACSLLSDAQEEMAMGRNERARQTLNIVKYLLSEKE